MTIHQIQDLKVGDTARILSLNPGPRAYRKRLIALGLRPGTLFQLTQRAPLGDPVCLRVNNTAISLRQNEARLITLEMIAPKTDSTDNGT